jgi:hypothetical protein
MNKKWMWTHPSYKRNKAQQLCLDIYSFIHSNFIKIETGLATAEYAIVAIAATAFAGILIIIVKSDAIKSALENIIKTALQIP